MNRKDIKDLYGDDEPGILFADGYDKAIAGVIWDGERTRVVYETEKILSILMEDGMTYDEASEYFDFNVAGSYMGVYTPLYLETWERMIKVKKHRLIYKKRNPIAREVRSDKYKPKVVPDRHKDRKEEEKWNEMINYLKSLS